MDVETPEEARLLRSLAEAVSKAPVKVREIEVGIALSIALGRQRPSVSCGGCSTPLQFEGIPAVTNARLPTPFVLHLSDGPNA
jgi:hypothetical protein